MLDGSHGSECGDGSSGEERSEAGQNKGREIRLAREQGNNVVGDLVYTNPSKVGEREGTTKPPGTILKAQELKPREPPRMMEKESGSSSEGLIVHVNSKEKNLIEFKKLKSKSSPTEQNSVTTSKYTVFNFLALNLTQQFSRLANVYFLIVASLQLFTPLSPTGRFSTAAPLALVVVANMLREIWEDSHRHADDRTVNHRKIETLQNGKLEEVCWKNLQVGDIVKGGSYIDTCNLDGETNLKIKTSLTITRDCTSVEKLKALLGTIYYEKPNKSLYTFAGKATIEGYGVVAVANDCVLLRGSVLRNTDYAYGIIIYAGKYSKIQMNSKAAVMKRSNVERMSNLILAGVFVFELVMCSLGCIGNFYWVQNGGGPWYLPYAEKQATVDVLLAWVTYFILLNNYIPISLYVSMELAKLGQKVLIDNDLEMYHQQTDTPCLARTSNLNEELGQIQYIFSDKTGTLTRNEMEFRKCWIADTSYGFGTTEIGLAAAARGAITVSDADDVARKDADPHKAQFYYDSKLAFDDVRLRNRYEKREKNWEVIRDFLRVLSVAHTVVPESEGDVLANPESVRYQAESPDESALVGAAKALGFCFYNKVSLAHSLQYSVDVFREKQQFEVLNINQFNSTRKRMSAVVKTPEGNLELYIKGADNVMFNRLKQGENTGNIEEALKNYGNEGLRTLIIAKRNIPPAEYGRWNEVYQQASTAIEDREQKLMDAAEEIERDLKILGATAIEDKLQIGVPEAIATLAKARIRIWVLTGDKQETAENIGFACNLLTDTMQRVYLVEDNVSDDGLSKVLQKELANYKQYADSEDPCESLSLIVDGAALNHIMKALEGGSKSEKDMELMMQFLSFAKMCKSVIACRVSPDQKRQIVAMVKCHCKPTPLTLAIGDGANDVPMILEASVGIGISGNEGMQAVRSADYAIAQFAYLKRLLLVHGRSNYKRISVVVMYSLYKNCFLVSTLFLYGFWTGWTGTALFDSFMLAGYNVAWAAAGIILYGSIENDVSPATALAHPQLYIPCAKKADFNLRVLVHWMVTAFIHTVWCLVIPVFCFMGRTLFPSGLDDGLSGFGLCVMQALVVAVNLKLMLATANLARLSVAVYFGSTLLFIIGALAHSQWILSSFFATEYYFFYDVATRLYLAPATWLVQGLTVAVILIPDVASAYIRRTYQKSPADAAREIELGFGRELQMRPKA